MSNPTITCTTCGRQRDCMRHVRADHPPTAAKKWLEKQCPHSKQGCVFTYHVGLDMYPSQLSPQNPPIE